MDRPREVEVADEQEIVERVAAIDVAKASGVVCTRVPHARIPGKRLTKVWEVPATTKAISELADHLVDEGIERVVLESTSDYWRSFFYVLEGAGLTVWLVNAKQVKNVPGRPKTDKLDAIWLAKLAERSMLSPSFVPAEQMRHVRDLARARFDLVADRSRVKQRVEKVLEDAREDLLDPHRSPRGLGTSDARGADQRRARPDGPRRAREGSCTGTPRDLGRGLRRPLHEPPRPALPDVARPGRRPLAAH